MFGSSDKMEMMETKKKRYVKSESGLKSVVESFKKKEKEIKESYAGKFEVTGEVCAWMMARDACFVLHVLGRFRKNEEAEESVSASIDGILSRKRHHPLLTEIVKDMLKMENQLPFWALKEIRPDIEDWFESVLKNLSPITIADEGYHLIDNKEYHILQLLHDHIVGSPSSSDHQSGSSLGQILKTILGKIKEEIGFLICQCLCACLCSCAGCIEEWNPYALCCGLWLYIYSLFRLVYDIVYVIIYVIVLLVLSPVFFIMFIIFLIEHHRSPKWNIRRHSPTVEELERVGVKFKKLEGEEFGISHIKFKERNTTLYLPQFKVDNRSEAILRNLIALEICSQEEDKPITRYVILMNDLINTGEDVGILRGEDIIINKLGSDVEIAQFWNSMVTSTEMPSYRPIDNAVLSIDDYRKKWWKVLWAQFVMAHCSKPWLFLSLLAGLLLLLLTFAQVICLFESCQIR